MKDLPCGTVLLAAAVSAVALAGLAAAVAVDPEPQGYVRDAGDPGHRAQPGDTFLMDEQGCLVWTGEQDSVRWVGKVVFARRYFGIDPGSYPSHHHEIAYSTNTELGLRVDGVVVWREVGP